MKRSSTVTIVVVVLAICATIVVWRFLTPSDPHAQLAKEIAEHTRATLGDAYKAVLTPRIQIDTRTIIEQYMPTLELATASRNVAAEYRYVHTRAGSTKIFVVQGTFIAKSGFDLSSNAVFGVDVDVKTMRMVANLPEPKLLSCDQKEFRIVQDESGWWNRLKPEDREMAINGLREVARQQAAQSGLLADAKAVMGTTITKALRDCKASDVEIHFR